MDVRAADTSNLAAKRLELDSVRPVTHKADGTLDQQQAVKSATGTGDDDSESGLEPEEDFEDESTGEDDEQVIDRRDDENDGGTDEKHILDVRV